MMIVEILIKMIGYSFLFFGIWRLSWPLLMDARRFRVRNQRLRKVQRKEEEKLKKAFQNPLFIHIRRLIFSVAPDMNENRLWNFYGLTTSLFFTSLISIGFLTNRFDFGLLIAIGVASIPYVLLRYRMTGIRLDGSLAFMKEFHIFMQAYQKNKDVYHSVYEVTETLHDKRLRLNFQKLLSSMQKDRSESSFIEAIHLFSYSLGSTYASRFTNLLMKSYRDHADIIEGLMDINRDLRKRERDLEELKTKRMETIFLGFMPLIILPIFIVITFRLTVMFQTSVILQQTDSLMLLIFIVFLSVICALCSFVLSKPRADL